MSRFFGQITCLIQPSLSRAQKFFAFSPTPISPPELDLEIPVLEDTGTEETDTEEMKKDIEAILEEAGEDSSAPDFHYIEREASRSMLANVEKLISIIHKNLVHCISCVSPCRFGYRGIQNAAKHSLFSNNAVCSCAFCDNWEMLEKKSLPQNLY